MNDTDMAGPGQVVTGAAGNGQENEELEWARRHVPLDPYLPVRKTEIIGWGVKLRYKVKRKVSGTSPDEEDEEEEEA